MTEIRVPTLGESVTEATIGRWFKKAGDPVAVDEPLVELETDKVTIEVPAPSAGTLSEIVAADGATVAVGALLGQITEGAGASARVTAVEVIDAEGRHKTLRADAFVVAIGSFSAPLLQPLGINLLVYPGKGYSGTYKVLDPQRAPTVSLTDDGYKLVVSRLGDRLRVAGTCELNGYTRELNMTRCEAITRRTRELFPDACDYDNPVYWSGLRPLTPSNVPYIGKTRYDNLFLNTGHGTLGWTMGAGSGRAIAEIVSGRRPEVDFNFTGMPRRNPSGSLVRQPA